MLPKWWNPHRQRHTTTEFQWTTKSTKQFNLFFIEILLLSHNSKYETKMYFSCARFVLFFVFFWQLFLFPFWHLQMSICSSHSTHIGNGSCVCTRFSTSNPLTHSVCWQFCQRVCQNVWREVDRAGVPHKVINFMFYSKYLHEIDNFNTACCITNSNEREYRRETGKKNTINQNCWF